MTESTGTPPGGPQEAKPPPGRIVRSLLRAAGSTAVLVAIYYLLPLDNSALWFAAMMLVIGLAALVALVALAVTVPLFLLLFASTYMVLAAVSAHSFSQPLNHTDALYFTVTVFATVGFGDITATTEATRLVVTGQMIADLVIIGIAVKAITGAVQQRRQQR